MGTKLHRPRSRHVRALGALCGLLAFAVLAVGLTAHAQEKPKKEAPPPAKPAVDAGKEKAPEGGQYRLRSIVRLGYTRPGSPDDPTKKGDIVPLAFTDYQGKILGGTVYFMVLERVSDRDRDRDGRDRIETAGDTWGTGMGDFDSRFIPGRNFDGGVSPRLDTKAKYLYLYQLVNDRGLDPREGVAFAAYDKVRAQDVASFGLKLLVDPRAITSWGYFQGAGFTALAPDRNQINQVRLAADGAEATIRLAVSSNPSILGELPQKQYRYRSPAYALGKLGRTMELGLDTLNLKASYNHQYLEKNKAVVAAAFVQNELQADEAAKVPNFVQVMYFGDTPLAAPDLAPAIAPALGGVAAIDDEGRGVARGMFRVDWRGENFVKLGQHSATFGFTSDLPPVDEPIGIADPEASLQGNALRQVVLDENIAPAATGIAPAVAPGAAPGTAPTPTGGTAAVGGGNMLGGAFGSLGGLGGIGGGGNLGFPGGALGGARAPFMGGGGSVGGGTNGTTGTGTTSGTTNGQNQQGTQTGGGQTVNFNATLVNQQQQQQGQFQLQAQAQSQSQSSSCCNMTTNNVVPAPASLLLGLFGLPGLYVMWRRQKGAATAAAA